MAVASCRTVRAYEGLEVQGLADEEVHVGAEGDGQHLAWSGLWFGLGLRLGFGFGFGFGLRLGLGLRVRFLALH